MTAHDELLTVADLAERWRVSASKVYQMLRRNQGPQPIRIGRHMRFRQDDVAEYESRQQEVAR